MSTWNWGLKLNITRYTFVPGRHKMYENSYWFGSQWSSWDITVGYQTYHILLDITVHYQILPSITRHYHKHHQVLPYITRYYYTLPDITIYYQTLPYTTTYQILPDITIHYQILPYIARYYHTLPHTKYYQTLLYTIRSYHILPYTTTYQILPDITINYQILTHITRHTPYTATSYHILPDITIHYHTLPNITMHHQKLFFCLFMASCNRNLYCAIVQHFTWVVSNYSDVQVLTSCSRTWNMYHILFQNLKHVPNLHPIMRQITLPPAIFLRFIWMLPFFCVSKQFSIFYGYSNTYLLRSGKANKKNIFC